MYVGSSLHETVVFIGFEDATSLTGMRCEGTGFLLHYKQHGHLITARHVAERIGLDPFVIRVNRRGQAELLKSDLVEWVYHPDPLVDLAAIRLILPTGQGFDCTYLPDDIIMTPEKFSAEGIGEGSLCYTVGLFHFIYGRNKNLPMVHAGNIALMPPKGELVPIGNEKTGKPDFVEGYLIESAAINGSSGSPVFVRPTVTVGPFKSDQGVEFRSSWPEAKLHLLGLFQGAWFAPPDDPVAENVRAAPGQIVPVGVGIVVPAHKIVELLETDKMRDQRSKNPPSDNSATPTDAATPASVSGAATVRPTDENPNAREDFMRLANAAARKQKQDE